MPSLFTRKQFLLAALSLPLPVLAAEEQPKLLTTEELEKVLKDEKNLFFLDVREPREIEEYGSVKGYVNIPLGQLENRLSEVPKDKTIITACERGVRAGRAAELLLKHGYKVLARCGLRDWREKNKPVVFPQK